jgi:hypothetical protein
LTSLFLLQRLVPSLESDFCPQLEFERWFFSPFVVAGKSDGRHLARRGRIAIKEPQIIAE